MTSLDMVELVMALESWFGSDEIAGEIGPGVTLGDLHWLLLRKERERRGQRRSADDIWLEIVKTLEQCGVPQVQIKPETRIEDLIS